MLTHTACESSMVSVTRNSDPPKTKTWSNISFGIDIHDHSCDLVLSKALHPNIHPLLSTLIKIFAMDNYLLLK